MMTSFEIDLANESEMLAFGERFAACCDTTAVIFLQGQLGAGKTTLVRGILRGLGFKGHVKSPTYTLVEPYDLPSCSVFHFDFYRLRDPQELEWIGIQDYFRPNAICLIEWPELGGDHLPKPDLVCHIDLNLPGRRIQWQAHSKQGQSILQRLYNEK